MISELRRSVNSILYERVTSPLFGTLITSWLIWNWKIVYITLFVSESKLTLNKVDYIVSNYNDEYKLYWYPLLQTFFLLLIVPFISNGSYWVFLKFRKWRIDYKQSIENNILLNFEQSTEIRNELIEREQKYEKVLSSKDQDIKILKNQLENLKERFVIIDNEKRILEAKYNDLNNTNKAKGFDLSKHPRYSKEFSEILNNKEIHESFETTIKSIKLNNIFPKNLSQNVLNYYLNSNIIYPSTIKNNGETLYSLTQHGETLYQEYKKMLGN